ncbi:MAG: SpaA isopeptide-forming pilin-related protein [Acetobacter sp.]|nr:SpaA isopeptide-forming pilin-related protein [Bacteroides sp.]MCM1341881.1 SpaA isopeptide-forming pilin-related protein [Acetobacter sp.]MCM1433178.1 SpaA isopeptide-forming pilin-related protein [Clostridiales bacterium]
MKNKIKTISKRAISMLLSLLIILSVFPTTVFADDYITDMNSNAKFGVISGSYDKYGHEMHYSTYGGKTYIVFCCQYGVTSPDGSTYEYGKEFKKYLNRSGDTYREIADYIAFGYTLQYGDGLPDTKAEWIAACCTQQFVWEMLGVNPSRSSWDSTYMSDKLYTDWLSDTEDLIELYYDKAVSFDGDTKKINLGGSTTLTDSNGVLKYYPTFSKTIDKVTFSHTKGENKLKISVASDCTTHSVKFNSASQKIYKNLPDGSAYDDDTTNYVYFEFEGNVQNLMFSKKADPQTFKIDVNIEFGNLKISKTSEDEIIKNITFTVTGNGKTYTLTTDSNGNAELKNIPIGTYTIKENDIVRYVKQATKTATVTDGKTVNVSFNNMLLKGNIKIQKNSEDKIVKDFTFIVKGSDGKTYNATTNADGIATITGVPVYDKNNNKITYTVQETNVPVRYVTPDNQTVTIEADKTSTLTFNNDLKKFRVQVTKTDVEKTAPQGDGTLAGASYGIYKGTTLVDTYYTDEYGQFTTDYYVCDTDWYIQELSSSEGYLVDGTKHPVGADPKLYTVEYNECKNAVTEQVIKGRIAIIKHTDNGDTQIETPEKDAEFQIYLKSAGSYEKADPDERDILVCDEYGYDISKLLPYGTYVVHQTKGWDGREFIKDFTVYVSENGKTYPYLINNSNFESYLKVVKKDAETGKTIPYANAGFQLYDKHNNLISMSFTYSKPTTIDTFYTNDEGYLVTPEKLPYGTNYKLVEVAAPYGYIVDKTPIVFDISADNATVEDALTIVKVEKANTAQKGTITVTKSGEVFSDVALSGNDGSTQIYQPVFAKDILKGAVFDIISAEDIVTLDGTTRAQKGDIVDTITTDDNGTATSKLLYLGKYDVKEKTAPYGMVLNDEIHSVELAYAGQNVEISKTATSFYNERQKAEIKFEKTMELDELFGLGNNGEVTSVTFGLYAEKELVSASGAVIPADALIEIINMDKNGKAEVKTDLPIGDYYIQEIATNNAYILNDNKYPVVFEYAGQDTAVVNLTVNDGNPIENKIIYGNIKGLKIDRETEKTIEGALFGLFNPDETEFTEDNALLTCETDGNGIFTFNNIPIGNWLIKELKPAENYLANDEIYPVQIDTNKQIIEFTVVNDRIPELKTTATVDGNKEVVAKGEITIDDVVEYKHLVPGKEYKIVGTLMDKSTGKPFEIDGKPVTSEVTFIPKKSNGKVNVEFTFDASGIKTDTELVVFETLYRDGIELTAHADINDKGQTVKLTPYVVKTPKTSDNSNKRTIATVMAISAFGIVSLAYYLIKRKKSNKGGKA